MLQVTSGFLNLYALENDGYGCYITGLLSTDLAGKLPFLQEGDFQYCSMVEDQQTGHLVLSYFTGDTSELFLLYAKEPDSLNLTAVRLGNLGDQNYPAVLYCAESNGEIPSSQSLNGCVLPILQAELPMKQLDLSALQETQEISAGTLHSATNQQEQPVNGKLQSLPQETVQAPQANEKTISIQIPAPQDSTNGLVHLTYDPALLTLDAVTPYAGLSSVNRETDGQVTLAYAGIPGLSGNSAAEVTFRVREDASGVTKVTCNTLEQGSQIGTQEQPVSTATFTYALSGGQVTGSAGHDCPSLRFRDLKAQWYHEAIDEALNKGLVNGMTEDLFQPEGTLTRAQFVTILHRLASCPDSSQDTPLPTSGPAVSMKRPCGGPMRRDTSTEPAKAPSPPTLPSSGRWLPPSCGAWQAPRPPARLWMASPMPRRSTPTPKRPWPGLWSRPLWLAPPPPPWLLCPPPPGPKAWSW